MRFLLFFFILSNFTIKISFAQDIQVCLNEYLEMKDTSSFVKKFEWDFCNTDLKVTPVQKLLYTFSSSKDPINFTLVQEGDVWFGFISNFTTGNILRLDFESDLASSFTVTDLGNLSNNLKNPIRLSFYKQNTQWYAIVADWGNNSLYRLSFVNGINQNPEVEPLGFSISRPYGVSIVKQGANIYAVASSIDKDYISIINFGDDITNSPIEMKSYGAVGDPLDAPGSISMIENDGQWIGLIASRDNNKIFRVTFDQGNLTNSPTFEEIASIAKPTDVKIVKEGRIYKAFVVRYDGELIRLDFNTGIDSIPNIVNLNNISLSKPYSFDIGYEKGKWQGFMLGSGDSKFYHFTFEDTVHSYVSIPYSEVPSPTVYYTEAGEYSISLNVYDDSGNKEDTVFYVTVTENQAPTIDMQVSSVCQGTPSSFSSISDQNLTSASWIINSDTLTGTSVNYTFPTPGTYTITLEVESENGCGNRLTKEITIYEPPEPKFSIPEGLICTNGAVAFTNLTDTQGADDLITYQWDFNGEGASTQANPSFTFANGGTKTVTLTAGIPGCSEVYDTTFTVLQGPQVDFAVPQICQGTEFVFDNRTTGDNITEYQWEFGDGGNYTSANANPPFYTYDTDSTFTVTLTVKNAAGCTNSTSRNITVYASPQVGFLVEVACAGKPVSFTDQTTAGITANVISWQWDFGDGTGSANIKNPEYTYPQPGTYPVKLVTQTSAGCQDSLVKEVVVESPVTTDFSYAPVCTEGAASYTIQFTDQSTVTSGNKITDWLWTVEGESFITQDMQYTFAVPGTYQISLTAFAVTACNAVITKTITVNPKPEVAFSYTGTCAGEPFAFVNETVNADSSVSRYVWDFGGTGTSFEDDPQFAFSDPGSYTVVLTAEMINGCAFSSEQTVEVPGKPVAQFTPSATFGAVPLVVQFDNQSQYASQYLWQIGESDTLREDSPAYTFSQPGTYEVTLTAENDSGCAGTLTKTITAAEPAWDLAIENMKLFPATNSGEQQIILTIQNAGTVTVENFPISIKIDDLLELREAFNGRLAPGERINYPLTFTLSEQVNEQVAISYICATLLDGDASLPDVKLSDNRACVNLSQTSNSLTPYPNPVSDFLDVSLVLSSPELVRITIENVQGKLVSAWTYADTRVGLNSFPLDMTGLAQGVYFVRVHYLGQVKSYRVVVQP